jgi:uncharacterized membrane protein HdeD (DUF308 family)
VRGPIVTDPNDNKQAQRNNWCLVLLGVVGAGASYFLPTLGGAEYTLTAGPTLFFTIGLVFVIVGIVPVVRDQAKRGLTKK